MKSDVEPPQMPQMPRIDKMWAFLSIDHDGEEGVCAASINGVMMPLIASDQQRVDQLTPIAEDIAREAGVRIRLVEFSTRTIIREIEGRH
jgi:hypothetical protein